MLCKQCGKEIPNTAVHCAYCGAATSSTGSPVQQPQNLGSLQHNTPATRGQRFINLVLDGIFMNIITRSPGALGVWSLLGENGHWSWWMINWLTIPFAYYFFTELMWSKSPAKFITKTHVVTDQGLNLTASQVVIRTISRWIPFEAFSFLFAHRPVGWHDRFAHTKVVED